jgi:hypothetical protein
MNRSLLLVLPGVLIVLLSGVTASGQRSTVSRGSAQTSVNRNANVNRNTNVNANRNVNVNQNVNVNRDVNVNVHGGYGYNNGCCYHPVAAAAAVTGAAMVTAAAIGSMVHTLPPACSAVVVNGTTYQQCGSTWYQPQFVGTTANYIVVAAPR